MYTSCLIDVDFRFLDLVSQLTMIYTSILGTHKMLVTIALFMHTCVQGENLQLLILP